MKIALAFFLLLPLAFANKKIRVRGLVDKPVFDCILDGFQKQEINSSVNICEGFKLKIGKTPGIEVEVTLSDLEDIEEFSQFTSEFRDFIKILKLELNLVPKNFSSAHLTRVFASVPSVTRLEIASDNLHGISKMKIEDHEAKFLPNLKTLSIEHSNTLLNFLSKFLTKDTLHEWSMKIGGEYSPAAVTQFIESQKNIKILKIAGNLKSSENFKTLKLDKFDCECGFNDGENDRDKLTDLIQSQPQLVDLNVIGSSLHFLDDELLTEICKMENLTNFEFKLRGFSASAATELKHLKKLKSIRVKSLSNYDLKKIEEMSKLMMPEMESIHLDVLSSLPSKIFGQFQQNYPNLKAFKMENAVDQNMNFFIKTFPQIEKLTLEFRERFSLFEKSDSLIHENLKSLSLSLTEEPMTETEQLRELMESFPNLEELKFSASFFLTPESLRPFLDTKIKRLSLGYFRVPCREEFSSEIIGILKEFDEKFESVSFTIMNGFMPTKKGVTSCLHLNQGKSRAEKKEEPDFTPLIVALKDDINIYKDQRGNGLDFIYIRGGTQIKTL